MLQDYPSCQTKAKTLEKVDIEKCSMLLLKCDIAQGQKGNLTEKHDYLTMYEQKANDKSFHKLCESGWWC